MVSATASFLFCSCFCPISLLGRVSNLHFFLEQLHFARHYNLILTLLSTNLLEKLYDLFRFLVYRGFLTRLRTEKYQNNKLKNQNTREKQNFLKKIKIVQKWSIKRLNRRTQKRKVSKKI